MSNLREAERAELHKTIWRIANDLRGSVDGWDFKTYVLGMLFYRFISENLVAYLNEQDRYVALTDAVTAVLGLVVHRRRPLELEECDVRRACERDPLCRDAGRADDQLRTGRILEFGDRPLACRGAVGAHEVQRVYVPLKRGSVTFHDGLTFHAASKNQSSRPRKVLSIIYIPDGVTFNGKDHPVTREVPTLKVGEPLAGDFFPLLQTV